MLHIRGGIGHPLGIQQLRIIVVGEQLTLTSKTSIQSVRYQILTGLLFVGKLPPDCTAQHPRIQPSSRIYPSFVQCVTTQFGVLF
jgi:hypothetical protein